MKTPKIILRVAAFLLLAPACEREEEDASPSLVPETFPEGFVEVRDCRFSVEHNAVHIRILAPTDVAQVYLDGQYPFAAGDLVVKQEFRDSACTELVGMTAMQRRSAQDPMSGGDWSWQRLDEAAVPIGPEDARTCSGCHESCTMGRDGVCADP